MKKEEIVEAIYSTIMYEYKNNNVSIDKLIDNLHLCDTEGEPINESWVSYFTFANMVEAVAKAKFAIKNDITVVMNLEKDTATSNQINIIAVDIEDHGSQDYIVTLTTEVLK